MKINEPFAVKLKHCYMVIWATKVKTSYMDYKGCKSISYKLVAPSSKDSKIFGACPVLHDGNN